MSKHESTNYIEFRSNNLSTTKEFFGWSFEGYGPEYIAFSKAGIAGRFFKSPKHSSTENGSALVVIYSGDLEATQAKIQKTNGKITKQSSHSPVAEDSILQSQVVMN